MLKKEYPPAKKKTAKMKEKLQKFILGWVENQEKE
jgi:hypothetical protein